MNMKVELTFSGCLPPGFDQTYLASAWLLHNRKVNNIVLPCRVVVNNFFSPLLQYGHLSHARARNIQEKSGVGDFNKYITRTDTLFLQTMTWI